MNLMQFPLHFRSIPFLKKIRIRLFPAKKFINFGGAGMISIRDPLLWSFCPSSETNTTLPHHHQHNVLCVCGTWWHMFGIQIIIMYWNWNNGTETKEQLRWDWQTIGWRHQLMQSRWRRNQFIVPSKLFSAFLPVFAYDLCHAMPSVCVCEENFRCPSR